MITTQMYIIIAVVLTALGMVIFFAFQRRQRALAAQRHRSAMCHLLENAQAQNQLFEISVQQNTPKHHTLSGMLTSISDTLEVEVLSYVAPDLSGEFVDVYFRIKAADAFSFYKFSTMITYVKSSVEKTLITLRFPEEIADGQKRQFYRVNPPKETVRLIGLWDMPLGKPAPRDTSEIGRPLLHYSYGMGNETVEVADISATGVALRFPIPDAAYKPVDLEKGSQVLCLIVYNLGKNGRIVKFWCICDVINVRIEENPPAIVHGMKFINWAVLEHGKSEINWFHSKQDSGVSPISQWVIQVDREQRRLL